MFTIFVLHWIPLLGRTPKPFPWWNKILMTSYLYSQNKIAVICHLTKCHPFASSPFSKVLHGVFDYVILTHTHVHLCFYSLSIPITLFFFWRQSWSWKCLLPQEFSIISKWYTMVSIYWNSNHKCCKSCFILFSTYHYHVYMCSSTSMQDDS